MKQRASCHPTISSMHHEVLTLGNCLKVFCFFSTAAPQNQFFSPFNDLRISDIDLYFFSLSCYSVDTRLKVSVRPRLDVRSAACLINCKCH